MRKLVIVMFMCIPGAMFAQGIGFRLDAGLGAALSFGELKSYGIAAFTEPKVTIGPSITAGVRFEGDALFGGTIAEDAQDL
jgi:hypothetical protein